MVYTLLSFKRLLLPVILVLMFTVCEWTEAMCGKPGLSPNCEYHNNVEGGEFQVGHTVRYCCKRNPCYTPNSMRRDCLENGSWSGVIPFCHERSSIKDIEQMLLIRGSSRFYDSLIMDDKNKTCSSTNIDNYTHWEVILKKSFRVIAVKILFQDGMTEVSARVQILEANRTLGDCETLPSVQDMNRNLQLYDCPQGVIGNKIRIIPIRTKILSETKNFVICEIYLFLQSNQACLRPDAPYKSRGFFNPPRYIFECNETSHELVGDNTVLCREDGTWTTRAFKCQKKCGKLPEVANGVLKFNSTTINSTAWLECNEGYRPLSDHSAHCLPTGMWTSLRFSCEMIKCDPNLIIQHGRAALPNGFAYGSKIHITCEPGYMAVESEVRECHKNGSWGNLNICSQIICDPLKYEVTNNGQWVPLNETILMRVLICQTNYHIEGSPAVTQCLFNGSWSQTTAVCKKTQNFDAWNSEWTPTTVLLSAVAVGAGTAISILCITMCFLVIRKRWQTKTKSTVFHVGVTDSILYHEQSNKQKNYKTNTYEDVIELRNNPSSTEPRKPSSALPYLPNFPVDTDPVYAQPFETSTAYQKIIHVSTSADIYTAHIYAEPVDSHRSSSGPGTFTCAAETWLRSGEKKFGRKMSLPGQTSLPENLASQNNIQINAVHKPGYESSNTNSLNTKFDEKQKTVDYEPKVQTTLSELVSNSIYLNTKERRITCKKGSEQLQMIDNDIYQDDYFSNV